jgi:hypothetical protein
MLRKKMYASCASKSSRILHFLASQFKPYRAAQTADPLAQIPRFRYSLKTSNSSLRPHIGKQHLDLYKKLAKERGWNILYVIKDRSETSDSVVPPSAEGEQCELFSEELFRKRLVYFIVADDQVCIFAP